MHKGKLTNINPPRITTEPKNAVQALKEKYGIRICDLSHEYSGYKDLNEYLCGKNNRLHNNRGIEKTV